MIPSRRQLFFKNPDSSFCNKPKNKNLYRSVFIAGNMLIYFHFGRLQFFFLNTLRLSQTHRPLFESFQQLLLDGVVQLSGDQRFLLQTPKVKIKTVDYIYIKKKTFRCSTSTTSSGAVTFDLTSFLFSRCSTFRLRGTSFLLKYDYDG